ncbi:MAG: CoA transferase, partial [Pseudomonadota bacterium]
LSRSAHPSTVPSQLFKTANGWVLLMCQTPKFWTIFCEKVGREDWLSQEDFKDIAARRDNRAAVQEAIDGLFQTKDTDHWIDLLAGHVPIAPVYDVAEALDNPYVADVGMVETLAHPEKPNGLRTLSNPIKLDGVRPAGARAPTMGEHTDEILKR